MTIALESWRDEEVDDAKDAFNERLLPLVVLELLLSSSCEEDDEKVNGGSSRFRGLYGGPISKICSSTGTPAAGASKCLSSKTLELGK